MMPTVDVLIASHHGRANGIYTEMFDDQGWQSSTGHYFGWSQAVWHAGDCHQLS